MIHYVYKLTEPTTGEYYIGVRSCNCDSFDDYYMGSMITWKPDKSKLYKVIIREDFKNREEANEYEYRLLLIHTKEKLNRNYHNSKGFCCYGKSTSDETKAKLSKINTGKKQSEKTKAKISKTLRGRMFSDEHKRKIGNSNRGNICSEESKRKMSKSQMGVSISEESKRKISKYHLGRKTSEETKAKMSSSSTLKRPIIQFTLDGKFIKEWNSATEAGVFIVGKKRSSISSCVRNKTNTAYGFKWEFKK